MLLGHIESSTIDLVWDYDLLRDQKPLFGKVVGFLSFIHWNFKCAEGTAFHMSDYFDYVNNCNILHCS